MDTHIDEWLVWLRAADLAAETARYAGVEDDALTATVRAIA